MTPERACRSVDLPEPLTPVTVTTMLAEDGPSKAQLQKGYDGCLVDLTPGKAAS